MKEYVYLIWRIRKRGENKCITYCGVNKNLFKSDKDVQY